MTKFAFFAVLASIMVIAKPTISRAAKIQDLEQSTANRFWCYDMNFEGGGFVINGNGDIIRFPDPIYHPNEKERVRSFGEIARRYLKNDGAGGEWVTLKTMVRGGSMTEAGPVYHQCWSKGTYQIGGD